MRPEPLAVRHIDGMRRNIIDGCAASGARRGQLAERTEDPLEDVAVVRLARGGSRGRHGLAYASQQESSNQRGLYRAQKIRKRLGANSPKMARAFLAPILLLVEGCTNSPATPDETT